MKEGVFSCENCSKTFTHQYKLNSHIILDHEKTELKFYCDICQKSNFQTGQTKGFPQKMLLENHMKINHVKLTEPKACPTCGEEFNFGEENRKITWGSRKAEIDLSKTATRQLQSQA